MKKIKVLSLFDGISVAQQALKELGYDVEYYASEIDKYASQITQKNHPKTIQVGSVVGLQPLFKPDLLIGGSPCQDLSIAKKNRQGLDGARSGLFWEYVRILKEVKPKYFVLENVNSMPKEAKAIITEALGVEPIMINASLVSAQNRKRLFWTNIPNVTLPKDRGILLKDILEENVDEKYKVNISPKYGLKGLCEANDKAKAVTASCYKGYGNDGVSIIRVGKIGKGGQGDRIYSPEGKSVGLSALGGGRGAKTGLYCIGNIYAKKGQAGNVYDVNGKSATISCAGRGGADNAGLYQADSIIRKLTPIECERLQSLPDNYTEGISNSQRYKCLGNAFNKEVVKHILKKMAN